jgi:hypothetical protein
MLFLYKMNCAHLDKARKTAKAPRQVNNAVTSSPEHKEDINDGHLDDLELQVYAARRQRSAHLSSELWKSLSPDEQKAWDSLSTEHKAAILKFGSTIKPMPTRNTTVNFADTSTSSDSTEDDPTADDATSPLSVNKTKVTPTSNTSDPKGTSPASLTRMLGTPTSVKDRKVNVHRTYTSHLLYTVANATTSKSHGSLVDRGANGGLAGSDMRVVATNEGRTVNITGIDNHQMVKIPIVTAGAYMTSNKGPVIGIFHQYGWVKSGRSIHSSPQLEHYKNDVNERSMRVGGIQRISTPDGYAFPLDIIDGLPHLDVRPYTDDEWNDPNIPHVIMTGDDEWDPGCLDCTISDDMRWYHTTSDMERDPDLRPFDEFGNFRHREGGPTHRRTPEYDGFDINMVTYTVNITHISGHLHKTTIAERDYVSLCPFFL